jgi:4-alpha-glucanotransferase
VTDSSHDLLALAARAGVDVRYRGWRGEYVTASRETVLAVLGALGHDVRDEADARQALAALEAAWWAEVAPPVVLTASLPLRVRADLDGDVEVDVTYEDGRRASRRGRLFDAPATDHQWREGHAWCNRLIALDAAGDGYHRIDWRLGERTGVTRWIAAPERAYGAPGEGGRGWGVFAPLYALRSARSGGAGDLGELERLIAHTAERGGRWVATLPLLAAFLDDPCEPSPYAPASRRFWNELYLDLSAAPGNDTPARVAERVRLATEPLVDYKAQYRWRRSVIDELAAAAWAGPAEAELIAFAAGDVADYAAFRAIGEVERTGWAAWPAALRELPPPFTAAQVLAGGTVVDRARWQTHVYAQWAMDRQLEALGGSLYLDLPVGVNRDAWEVWRDRPGFALGLSAGAPPDALFLGGQDWGLPPVHPERARAAGWEYVIACIRHHMRHAGMLRVDHVMGLHRLYCVPAGMRATEGAYVRYAADELYAILCLESHRNRCAVVGEDLGTVPDSVPPAMRRHGLAGLYVAEFAMPGPIEPSATQVASMNTHDTPTFGGWWRATDVDDKLALGLIDEAQAVAEREGRAAARRTVLGAIGATDADPTLDPDSEEAAAIALLGVTRALSASDASVVLATLEDAWLEASPQNVPGTAHERPNWRRPFALDADAALGDPRVEALLAATRR